MANIDADNFLQIHTVDSSDQKMGLIFSKQTFLILNDVEVVCCVLRAQTVEYLASNPSRTRWTDGGERALLLIFTRPAKIDHASIVPAYSQLSQSLVPRYLLFQTTTFNRSNY